jgi:hypothetical protein
MAALNLLLAADVRSVDAFRVHPLELDAVLYSTCSLLCVTRLYGAPCCLLLAVLYHLAYVLCTVVISLSMPCGQDAGVKSLKDGIEARPTCRTTMCNIYVVFKRLGKRLAFSLSHSSPSAKRRKRIS